MKALDSRASPGEVVAALLVPQHRMPCFRQPQNGLERAPFHRKARPRRSPPLRPMLGEDFLSAEFILLNEINDGVRLLYLHFRMLDKKPKHRSPELGVFDFPPKTADDDLAGQR